MTILEIARRCSVEALKLSCMAMLDILLTEFKNIVSHTLFKKKFVNGPQRIVVRNIGFL